jgi:hypothetical protein
MLPEQSARWMFRLYHLGSAPTYVCVWGVSLSVAVVLLQGCSAGVVEGE